MRTCGKEGCEEKYYCRGLCYSCYCKSDIIKQKSKCFWRSEKGKAYRRSEAFKEKILKANKKYRQTEKCKIVKERYRQNHNKEINARNMANKKIKRQQCEIANCKELGERHHDDYSKPLEVRFLCIRHHSEHRLILS